MTGAGEVDHIQVELLDDPIQMGIDKVLTGNGTPVSDNVLFQMLRFERFLEEWVVQQIELAGGEVVAGAPPGVDVRQFARGERLLFGHTGIGFK